MGSGFRAGEAAPMNTTQALERDFTGPVIRPGDPGCCTSLGDVVATVNLAREMRALLAIATT